MTAETPQERAEQAAFVLAPETGLLADADVAGLGRALGLVFQGAMSNPAGLTQAGMRYAACLAQIPAVALSNWLGSPPPPVPINPKDKRFADRAWSENPAFFALRLGYQAFAGYMDELVSAARLDHEQEAKARLTAGLMVDALAPTNYFPTNPAAVRRAVQTGGASLAKGMQNFVDDLLHNQGRPRQVDTSKFTVGKSGPLTDPPPMGSSTYPVLYDAPGEYIRT